MLEARREGKVGEKPDLLLSFHSVSDTVAGTFYTLSKWMEHIYPTHDDSFQMKETSPGSTDLLS